jgi:hypothetical protein
MSDELEIGSDRESVEVGRSSNWVREDVILTTQRAAEKAPNVSDDATVAARPDASPRTLKMPPSASFRSALSSLKSGRNLVHQKAILKPLSTTRCLRMNKTTKTKKKKSRKDEHPV